MALGILVYENDLYLYSLIRERISSRFPGAYIERAGQEDQITDPRLLTDLCIVYDNRQFDPPDQGGAGRQIPLFADDGKGHSIIDMRRVIRQIGGERTSDTVTELAAAAGTDRKRNGKTAAKASPAPAATETGRGIVRTAILTDL